MTKKLSKWDRLKWEMNPIATGKNWWGRKGIDVGANALSLLSLLPFKKGGRVKGVGKATHGFGKAMRKQGK